MGAVEEVKVVLAQMEVVWKEKYSKIADFYTEDAIGIYPEAGKVVGCESLGKLFDQMGNSYPGLYKNEIEYLVSPMEGKAVLLMHFGFDGNDTWALLHWKKVDGKWLVAFEIMTTK